MPLGHHGQKRPPTSQDTFHQTESPDCVGPARRPNMTAVSTIGQLREVDDVRLLQRPDESDCVEDELGEKEQP